MSVAALEHPGRPLLAPAVRRFRDDDGEAWDRLVRDHDEGSFFHLSGWRRVIEGAFGHRTHYLLAQSGDRIEGVLPLVEVRSRLFGHSMSSLPFCVYGGVLATSDGARAALENAAEELAQEQRVDYLEMRNRQPRRSDWLTKDLYVTFRKPIDADPDVNLRAVPRKQRAMIRKGIKAGLGSRMDTSLGDFYACYSESVRNLGTPVFSRRYFRLLAEVFGEDCEITTVTHESRPVASVMSFYFRDEVLPYYGGGTSAARAVAGNDYLYWAVMSRAAERGARLFDYGRSKVDTGSYRFKKHWGFEPEPLHYEYRLVRARAMPNVSPANPKYRLFIAAWKKLPLPLSRLIGPLLARNLG